MQGYLKGTVVTGMTWAAALMKELLRTSCHLKRGTSECNRRV